MLKVLFLKVCGKKYPRVTWNFEEKEKNYPKTAIQEVCLTMKLDKHLHSCSNTVSITYSLLNQILGTLC
jgi:hypothetical protein